MYYKLIYSLTLQRIRYTNTFTFNFYQSMHFRTAKTSEIKSNLLTNRNIQLEKRVNMHNIVKILFYIETTLQPF